MTGPLCGARHHHYPDTLCTEPAGHYVRDRDSHAGPLIIDGRERGGAAWDEPEEQPVTDRIPLDAMTSDQLDALYDQRDEARQHAAAIAAQRDRLRQRMYTLANRWDDPVAPDQPTAHALRNEISVAPFDPDGAMTVRDYTERGRTLWAFRCWGTDTCDGWLGLGHPTQTSALAERERHVAEAHKEPEPPVDRQTARVRALHTRVLRMEALVCAHCGHTWPCDTIRALDGTEPPAT
jgi:hypothetical protein